MSQAALAKLSGVSQATIADIERGRNAGSGKIVDIARALKCSPDWLANGKGQMRPSKQTAEINDQSDFTAIKRVQFKVSAGVSGYEVEYLNGHRAPIFFRRDWLQARHLDADGLFAVEVAGQSMETSLYHGDLVVVNTADQQPSDGDVFAVNYEGEVVVKRTIRNGGEWYLSSDNPDKRRFGDKLCDERTSIIGRIVYKQSERI